MFIEDMTQETYQNDSDLYSYKIEEEILYSEEEGEYTSYGIKVLQNGVETEFISDVTQDREALLGLVRTCNREKLHAIHIHDVIDDFLAE